MRSLIVSAFAFALAGCGVPHGPETPQHAEQSPAAAEVFAAPNDEFEAVEPTVFRIIGAPTVWDALAPLGQSFAPEGAGPALTVRIRVSGNDQVADVLRTDLADDAINSQHIRIEFRREPEGWYPTNAYVRQKCRRGPDPEIWTRAPCP
jgi:hypothetical protein